MVDWLNLSETSGSGYQLVSVTALPNYGSARTTSLIVSGHTVFTNVSVSQEAQQYHIDITPYTHTFSSSGGTQQYTINSDVGWNITSYPNWVTISAFSGDSGTTVITVTASTNTVRQDRTATIVVEGGGVSASTTIIQEAYNPPLTKYLTFVITSGGYVKWYRESSSVSYTMEYRKNGGSWVPITVTTDTTTDGIQVVSGDVLEFRGDNYELDTLRVYSTALFEAEGNIMSIVSSTNFDSITALTANNTFKGLFKECTGITSAEYLILPATVLSRGCYDSMFDSCTSLTTPPELPATTLDEFCYYFMFFGCTSLTTAPELPAMTLNNYCYYGMFMDCTSLTTAPELPATTLANGCYNSMFWGCAAMSSGPSILPAMTLTDNCYQDMFHDCTSLTTAPTLPAKTLVTYCYLDMFYGCTSLNSIKCLATYFTTASCTSGWVTNVSSTGTFTKASATNWPSGNNGIPYGWTVINE